MTAIEHFRRTRAMNCPRRALGPFSISAIDALSATSSTGQLDRDGCARRTLFHPDQIPGYRRGTA